MGYKIVKVRLPQKLLAENDPWAVPLDVSLLQFP